MKKKKKEFELESLVFFFFLTKYLYTDFCFNYNSVAVKLIVVTERGSSNCWLNLEQLSKSLNWMKKVCINLCFCCLYLISINLKPKLALMWLLVKCIRMVIGSINVLGKTVFKTTFYWFFFKSKKLFLKK